ncbi:hypothetical protein PG996_013780 [Apiospora saccharicola]|uniref:Uncharacterized protein n=1 Tax=Apiospora saccharicola TaxID=335842 RepID=A0ABR1TGF2_9PEZI
MAPKIKLGKGGSREVREFSQVEDFGRDIKVDQDVSCTPTTGAATVGSPPPNSPQTPTFRPLKVAINITSDKTTNINQHHNNHNHLRPTVREISSRRPMNHTTATTLSTTAATATSSSTMAAPWSDRLPPSHPRRCDRCPSATSAACPPFDPRWHTIKRILTLLSMTWSIVILVLSVLFAVHGGLADGVGLWSLPITIAALLFNSAELLTCCVRSHLRSTAGSSVRRGMHPGAHVGGHLCFWLTCALAIYLSSSVYTDVLDTRRDCNSVAAAAVAAADGAALDAADFEVLLRGHCNSNYHFASNLGLYREGFYVPGLQALLAMFVMATVTHFALFVRACVEVDRRNQLRFSREEDLENNAAAAAAAADSWPGQWEQYYYRRSTRKNSRKNTNDGRAPEMTQQQQYV